MFLRDFNGPTSAQPRFVGLGSSLRRSGAIAKILPSCTPIFCGILFLSSLTCGAMIAQAQSGASQDVAAAARRERAQKKERQKAKPHVYTNDDLTRAKILTPTDQARVEARREECAKKNNCAPAENSPAGLDADSRKPGSSLGEIARRYRKQKEAERQLDALKPKTPGPYHLPATEPALASPILPGQPAMRRPMAPRLRPGTNGHVTRRDPFARAPMQPERPEVQPEIRAETRNEIRGEAKPGVAPDARSHEFFAGVRPTRRTARRKFPRAPKISPALAAPILPAESEQPTAPAVRSAKPNAATQPETIAPNESAGSEDTMRPMEPARTLPMTPSAARTIIVQRGDSLWKVAQENLGSGNRWPELAAANPWISQPERIQIGARLALPATVAVSVRTAGRSTKTVTVHKGDTLWSLAKTNLGHWSAWPCLAAANPSVTDPNRILEGQELAIPAACPGASRISLLPDER